MFIEQAQNIIRYSHRKTKATGDSIGTIAISIADDGFLIEAVNVVDPEKKDVLEATLVDLSMKDQKELRELYKKRLREGPPEDSSGAGLGFIEMARRVKKFEFDFVESEDGALFVYRGWVS